MGYLYSDEHIEQKMLELKENDLTKKVLIPLFKGLYDGKVEFVGGGPEKGRDILITTTNEFDEEEFTAIQVKKVKLNANAAQTQSLQNVITQLNQCKNEKYISTTGTEHPLKNLIFVTPYLIEQKVLDVHKGALSDAIKFNVRVLGGYEIIKLAKKNCSNVFDCLFEHAPLVSKNLESYLNLDEINKALNLKSEKNMCDIYCAVDSVVGNISKISLLNKRVVSNSDIQLVKVSQKQYFSFYQKYLTKYEELFGKSVLTNANVDEEVRKYKWALEEETSSAKELEKALSKEVQEIILHSDYKTNLYNYISHPGALIKIYDEEKRKIEALELENKLTIESCNLYNFLERFIQQVRRWNANQITIKNNSEELKSRKVDLSFKLNEIIKEFQLLKLKIEEAYNKKNVEKCLNLIEKFKVLSTLLEKLSEFIEIQDEKSFIELKFGIENLMSSGKNILLLGAAGSGKTTNLKNFAIQKLDSNEENLIIFTPLAKLYKEYFEDSLSDRLIKYIQTLGSRAEKRKIEEHFNRKGTIIFLDSIDEAIPNHPMVVQDIIDFSRKFPFTQVITSSRFTIDEVSELDFCQLSLLKFNREQKEAFFKNWFSGDDVSVGVIMEHLELNPSLSEVVSNPLATTILASLYEKKVTLPSNEAQLYKKRFELLCGSFDAVKGVQRTSTEPDDLLNASQIIAFDLHRGKVRSVSKESAINILEEAHFEPKGVDIEVVVDELIFPAEILCKDLDGCFDFGHLRYQEYLASRELIQRTDVLLNSILCDKWWHDSLLLLSQDTRDIKRFVYDAQLHGYTSKAPILKEMLKNRKGQEHKMLANILNIAVQDEAEEYDYDLS